MRVKKTTHPFRVGDQVRVRAGTKDPEYDDLTIGGWAGAIIQIEKGKSAVCLVQWSDATILQRAPVFGNRCERDGLHGDKMRLASTDIEPDSGGPLRIEQPTNIITRPLSPHDQDDRIRAACGLTSDDPLPEIDNETLAAYYQYLIEKLSFPFAATYSFRSGPFGRQTFSIQVLALLDPDEFVDDAYGLVCQVRRERKRIEVSLSEIEVVKRDPHQRLIEDYSYWIRYCR